MDNGRLLTFSLVTLAGAVLAGSATVAHAIRVEPLGNVVLIIGAGIGCLGLAALVIEFSQEWARVGAFVEGLRRDLAPPQKKPQPDEAKD